MLQLIFLSEGEEDWLAILKGAVKVSNEPVGMHLVQFMGKIIFHHLRSHLTSNLLTRDLSDDSESLVLLSVDNRIIELWYARVDVVFRMTGGTILMLLLVDIDCNNRFLHYQCYPTTRYPSWYKYWWTQDVQTSQSEVSHITNTIMQVPTCLLWTIKVFSKTRCSPPLVWSVIKHYSDSIACHGERGDIEICHF